MVAITVTGCGGNTADTNGKKRIVILTNGDDPFWDACFKGMEAGAKDFKIEKDNLVHAIDKGSEFKADKQLEKLEQYATQTDIAAVAISPVEAKNPQIAKAMKALRDKGVVVICLDSDMDTKHFRDSRFAYVGTDNRVGGEELGKTAKGLKPEGAKYATFVGLKTVANAIERIQGFADGAGSEFQSLDSMADDGDRNVAQENVKVVLDRHADAKIDMLVGIWAYNAHAIVKVVEERNAGDQQTVVVFDAATLALEHLKAGRIDAMVVQNPYQMGYLSAKLMAACVKEDHASIKEIFKDYDPKKKEFTTPDGDIFNTELRVVVPDETSPLKKEMFRPEVQFFYYKQFKAWLNERGLQSS